jgi:hypothetical protein
MATAVGLQKTVHVYWNGTMYIYKNRTNGKWQFPFVCCKQGKQQTSVCFLQKEMENENLFSLVSKQ